MFASPLARLKIEIDFTMEDMGIPSHAFAVVVVEGQRAVASDFAQSAPS